MTVENGPAARGDSVPAGPGASSPAPTAPVPDLPPASAPPSVPLPEAASASTPAPAQAPAPESPPPPAPVEPPRTVSALRKLLRTAGAGPAAGALAMLGPARRAELFLQLRPAEQKQILGVAAAELAAGLLSDCDSASLVATLSKIELGSLAPALRQIAPDDLADLLLRLRPELAEGVLAQLDAPLAADVRRLMAFDPRTAGGLMTTRYLSVPEVLTVGRAVETLRSAHSPESPSYVYVVDVNGKLTGVAPLRSLLMAGPRAEVRSIMRTDLTRLRTATTREEIVGHFSQRGYISLPVVDERDRLVGIVTFDDVMAAISEQERSVIQGVTGADPRESVKETLAATRGRLPWISVTIASGLGCAVIAGLFQQTLAELVVLGIFLPVVLALGESLGAQTTSVVLSTFAARDLSRGELLLFAGKEALISGLVGLYAGAAVGGLSFLWHGDARLGGVIGGAVAASMLWAGILAVVVPAAMRRWRVNTAVASGPLVLALVDLSTLVLYFGGAAAYLAAAR
ncbi:MAG: magnesium transporter [Planctomycetes bacterium]|nr:magnesium transporter [Planctomycetota bacterium]